MQYNTDVTMENDAAQHKWCSAILETNTISNTGKLTKMVQLDLFSEDSGSNTHRSDSENW